MAVARALVGQPSILLADEPTGNLDSKNGEAVMELLRELHRGGATICMVTHDPRFARYADRTVHLFDGRVVDEQRRAAALEAGPAGWCESLGRTSASPCARLLAETGASPRRRGHPRPGHRRQHHDLRLVHAVLLRPLPFADPDELVAVYMTDEKNPGPLPLFSHPNAPGRPMRTTTRSSRA